MATLIKANGTRSEVKPSNGKYFSLKELHGFVGGYIELIPLGEKSMYLNENGKYMNLEYNDTATQLAVLAGIADGDFVVGDIVIVANDEQEPDEEE